MTFLSCLYPQAENIRNSKEYDFPTITRIARDYLAIPATSAASESFFSVGGDIITKKRNRLSVGNTRRLGTLFTGLGGFRGRGG